MPNELYTTSTPNVDISGLGTGATASATVTGDSVTGVTLLTGGQGYEQTPTVDINLGSITQILYR